MMLVFMYIAVETKTIHRHGIQKPSWYAQAWHLPFESRHIQNLFYMMRRCLRLDPGLPSPDMLFQCDPSSISVYKSCSLLLMTLIARNLLSNELSRLDHVLGRISTELQALAKQLG